ncbi:Fe-S cluster assembly protein HesB [Novacetimonas maltaceti]|uniref:Iron-sulfur cluster insertion protein ErpA n=1 Tax=Novacetimonas maltaceti TaxID=1203393 RepID=A0A2S3W1D4_9PROT|nr:iron-sulfur cluster assembly accessory protein [Novacetimonas maltaceti]POF62679.1 Iron-sulfur cluster insertion protein ErpA [Novacetimonas maltaceti]PYD61051.1 Fe-S cluster assembly protein HesB [Novacetimonas maltaceti]
MDKTADHPTSTRFRVSDGAVRRLREIIEEQGDPTPTPPGLRVSVLAGGCNGFQYKFALETDIAPDDILIPAGETHVIVDPASLDLLDGGELDFKDSLMGAHFTIHNPQATSSCGCGTSFSVD